MELSKKINCETSGGRELRDEFGLYDNMSPVSALTSEQGLSVAIYLTKPPQRGAQLQEIHLLRLITLPDDIAVVYHGRA